MANEPGALLYRATDLIDAGLIHEALRASGIPVVSTGGNVMVNKGMPAAPYFLEIWVPAGRLAEAARVVEESRTPEVPIGAPWTCPSCSAANEPGFDLCWSCGVERAG